MNVKKEGENMKYRDNPFQHGRSRNPNHAEGRHSLETRREDDWPMFPLVLLICTLAWLLAVAIFGD